MYDRALGIAATGMAAQQTRLEVNANNIANMNSTAYNAQMALFAPMAFKNEQRVGSINSADGSIVPTGIQLGSGVKPVAVVRDLSQGIFVQSDDDYHVAIDGQGYFHIKLPSGEDAYTRTGTFTLDQEGTIVTLEGYKVQPEMKIPQNTLGVTITPDGDVLAKIDGQVNQQNVGSFQLAVFPNPGGLEALHNNYYQESTASGSATLAQPGNIGYGSLSQHYFEGSNVNAIKGVTDLIGTQQAYQMNTKTIEAAQKMMDELGRI